LAAAFYLGFCYGLAWFALWGTSMSQTDTTDAVVVRAIPLFALALSGAFFTRYFYVFYAHFSKLVLRSFMVIAGSGGARTKSTRS